jgi:putative ABC transport system permease protein
VKALLSETALIVGIGIGIGIGMSYLAREICQRAFPTLVLLITGEWILNAAAIAIIGGLLGATYPAWLASRKDPLEALAYE